jgi:GIY-YIG catalytic domain
LNWVVYMLEGADKSLYPGITTNLERRLAEHGAGKGPNTPEDAVLSGWFTAKPVREEQRPPGAKPRSN